MSDKILQYKSYCGSVEVSFSDGCLNGEILHINDLVTYEAKTPVELEQSFHEAVDNYLNYCEKKGLSPNKPFSGTFNIRISPDLHKEAAIQATLKGQTLNDFIKKAVADAISGQRVIVSEMHHHTHEHKIEISSVEEPFEQQEPLWQLRENQKRRAQH